MQKLMDQMMMQCLQVVNEVSYSDVQFIDDETNFQDQGPSDYCLMNVTRDLHEALQDQSMSADLGECTDSENFVSYHVEEIEPEFYEFNGFKNKTKKFEQDLKIFEKDSNDSFYFAIFHATYHVLEDKKEDFDFCQDRDKLIEVFRQMFFEKLKAMKESLRLDLSRSTFETQCHVINDLLMRKNLFQRVYDFRKKFCYLVKNAPQNTNFVQRDLSACAEERFNDFDIVRNLIENEVKELFKPNDIVYRPVSKLN